MSDWGTEVEEYARRLAASLGVADFVYLPAGVANASGKNREVSDGLLAVGSDGLILQVKSRDRDASEDEEEERARSWLEKHAEKARSQANGTRRSMQAGTHVFTSVRGYERAVEPPIGWKAVVILDHPHIPSGLFLEHDPDTLWITLNDWYGLHERLRSTAAVIEYVERALESGLHVALGHEIDRYETLLAGDIELASKRGTRPRLPPRSLFPDEFLHAALFDEVIDLVHDKEDAYLPWDSPDEYRLIVETLDRVPPGMRVVFGEKLEDLFLRMRKSSWWVSSLVYDKTQDALFVLAFDAAENWDSPQQFIGQLTALLLVRCTEAREAGLKPHVGLGVGILDHGQTGRSRWYAFVDVERSDLQVPTDIEFDLKKRFGVFDGQTISRLESPGRNDPCPCGSGRKCKRCHCS